MRKLLCLAALLCVHYTYAQKTILYCGKLIDPKNLQVLTEMSILVQGGNVTGVEKGYIKAATGDKVIHLEKQTVMPGLIDCHVHLENTIGPDDFVNQFKFNPQDIAYLSVGFADSTLLAGFTTVRDLGGTGVNISLRNAINKGLLPGPRVHGWHCHWQHRRPRRPHQWPAQRPNGRPRP